MESDTSIRQVKNEAEEAQETSERRFRALIENGLDNISLLTAEGVLIWESPSVFRTLGYAQDEFIGRSMFELMHPDDVLWTRDLFAGLVQEPGGQRKGTFRLRHRSGEWRWTEAVATNLLHERSVQAIVVNYRDITERKQADQELVASEVRYRRLFESAKDGILILNAETGLVDDVNPFLTDLLGFSREQVIGQAIWDLGFLRDVFANKEKFFELQQQKYIRYEDMPLETAAGQRIEVEFVSNVYTADHKKVIQCNIRDITGRKQAEAERERLMLAIEQAVEVIILTDTEGTIQYVNPSFEVVTGYTREEAIGQNPRILNSGLQDKDFYCAMWETVSSGKTWEGRFVNKKKDGTLYTEEATISPVHDAAGTIVSYVAVKRDITDRLRLQEERTLLEAQYLQAQKMEAVGRLAGGVAHDFNNMLQAIMGYSYLALSQVTPDTPLSNNIEQIQAAAQRSSDLTHQLLAFARRQTASPQVLDLNDAVSSILKMLHRLIGEDIDLVWKPDPDLWRVKIDPSQIDQILANLTVNARDAIAGVGKVTIESGNAVFDETYCANHAGFVPGEYVQLSVSDGGCGMDRETLDHIFEPFFTTKEVGEGTGLGLATVYGIVNQNDGFINVYSEPGEGTTFRIYLPRFTDEISERRLSVDPGDLRGGKETVLLVEDEESILEICKRILEGLGYAVLTAGKPSEAIHLADEHPGDIHILITDVIMPEMNGRELAERLALLKPGMKCLFMSGYTANVIAHRGVLEEGLLFIQKPFSEAALAAKVREALEG